MSKEKKKNIIYVVVLIALMALTFTLVFRNYDFDETMQIIRTAEKKWIVLGVLLNCCFLTIGAFNLKILLKTLGSKVSMINALKYFLVETYFCAVTPSASGGQPMEMLEMKRDGIALSKSTVTLIVIAIAYKSVLIVYAAIMLILMGTGTIFSLGHLNWLFYLGIVTNVLAVVFMVLALFCGDVLRKALIGCLNLMNRIHKLKRYDKYLEDINKMMSNYREGAAYIFKHRKVFYTVMISTFIQRSCRFAVTYAVYRALGLSGYSLGWIVLVQAIVCVSSEMIPVPGAIGVSESCYLAAAEKYFGKAYLVPSMVLSRGISFYGLLALSGIVVIIIQLTSVAKNRE